MTITKITTSKEAWKLLNGVACVHKQPNQKMKSVLFSLKDKLCEELNLMKTRPPQTHVEIRKLKSGQESPKEPGKKIISVLQEENGDRVEVVQGPSYADHPFVIGPRYRHEDFKQKFANFLGRKTSGVLVIGLNEGAHTAHKMFHSRWIREFRVTGVFGAATDTFFTDGKIVQKATYHKIKPHMLSRILARAQASHQQQMFKTAGVPLDSQRAFELASKGLLRPALGSDPVVYSLKLVEFDLPNFEIEMKVINETEQYCATLIHELALKLNSVAACSKIRCTQFGPFTLQHALLRKHFGVAAVINNIQESARILRDFDMNVRDPLLRVATPAVEEEEQDESYVNEDEEPRRPRPRTTEPESNVEFSR